MSATWPVLLVAAFGVVGTLGGSILTQMLTTRREERRWEKERDQEERRWEREREDRARQWEREDQLRHNESREEIYADFMKAIWAWGRIAAVVRTSIEQGRTDVPEKRHDELTDSAERAVDLLALLELRASATVRKPARHCCNTINAFCRLQIVPPVSPAETIRLHQEFMDSARETLERMREDRGLAALVGPQIMPADESPVVFG